MLVQLIHAYYKTICNERQDLFEETICVEGFDIYFDSVRMSHECVSVVFSRNITEMLKHDDVDNRSTISSFSCRLMRRHDCRPIKVRQMIY